jgi:heterodisulfide reductase subunit A2
MVSVGRHPNIELLAYSEVEAVSGFVGNFNVRVRKKARYIDASNCTGCGKCAEVCPIEVSNAFDLHLSKRKATYRNSAQAVPNAFAIDKKGVAPCRAACPTDQRAQGYIALIHQRRYADAYWAIRREHPFPSVCGRVCNHRCEDACSRGKYDQPVNIMGLKRFASDWAYAHRDELPNMRDKSVVGTPFVHKPTPTGKKVAIVGAGPAGLTAALDLVRLGYAVTVFDALPVAGGMMRVGIPPHRLPSELIEWEIQQIIDEGVDICLNTHIDDVPGLLERGGPGANGGYNAVLIATGAHVAKKLPIRNSNHPDNWMSLDLLRRVSLGEKIDLHGKKVVVMGGGNVALDSSRTVLRLGAAEVYMACLEPRGEMPGFAWEVGVAEQEGVQVCPGRTFKEIVVQRGKIKGVRCMEVNFKGFKRGRPDIDEIPGTEHILPADLVIWAIGQGPDFSFLPPDGSINTRYPIGIQTDAEMMTTFPGVFCAGDVQRGMTFFVVDAIGEGHRAARCIDRYLRGENGLQEPRRLPVVELSAEDIEAKFVHGESSRQPRIEISCIPLEERRDNFREVDLPLMESEALAEAERCLRCGICSECLECVAACERGAVNHEMEDQSIDLQVGTIVLATGFKDFDPAKVPELGYGRLPNVITSMEFERLINSSGPTGGKVLLNDGRPPQSVAILHCVGSRDDRYHEYCSRACCMYSLKIAQLVKDYVQADVFEIYRDMRAFGKDYEEFFNRTQRKGVHFYHGLVNGIEESGGKLVVHWDESFHGQPNHVAVDLVILATAFEPQEDTSQIASLFGVSRSGDGYFLEKHPKLAPVETANEGIYLAGACQSPKDIPDSVAQAGGAAAAALSLIDQGVIDLDPVIAFVDERKCAGCGQCVSACPYNAIELSSQKSGGEVASVNGYLCKGCGTCAGACPNKAMSLIHYDDRQIVSEMIGALAFFPDELRIPNERLA